MAESCSNTDCCRAESSGPGVLVASVGPGAAEGVALTALAAGQVGTVLRTSLDPGDAALLRAMGLRPASRVRLCRAGEPCVIEVLVGSAACACASRIGMARALAAQVVVRV